MATKLRNSIKFLEQRGEDLERVIIQLARQLVDSGIRPNLFVGIKDENDLINDVNTGYFQTKCLGKIGKNISITN